MLTAPLVKERATRPRLRPLRHRACAGPRRVGQAAAVARPRLRRADDLSQPHRPRARRCPALAALGPVGGRRRLPLQHRSARPRGDGRRRAGAHRALRLGRRLSRRDGPPPRGPGRLDARHGRAGVRRALVGRRRARAGEGLCLAGRHRVDRQEHVRHQPRDRFVDPAGHAGEQRGPRAGRRGRRSVRHLPAVYRRVSGRRVRRSPTCSTPGDACRT